MRENWRCVVEFLFAAIQAVIDEGKLNLRPPSRQSWLQQRHT